MQIGNAGAPRTSVTVSVREPLINPSFRRMPESIALNSLDPGMRRDDEKRINQRFPKCISAITALNNKCLKCNHLATEETS